MSEAREHPAFTHPTDRTVKIWRYMDFTKFVGMLEHTSLFFARSDLLGDPFEGSFPPANDVMFDHVHRQFLDVFVGDDPQKREQYVNSVRKLRLGVKGQRPWMLVSCWHMNEHESAAMWKLYTDGGKSICIQSTYDKLRSCLPSEIYTGVVRYIDYEKQFISEDNYFRNFMHKRKSFEHEREIRAIWPLLPKPDEDPPAFGSWQSLDLQELIEKVFVSPDAPLWFADLARKVIERYVLDVPLVQSTLSKDPIW